MLEVKQLTKRYGKQIAVNKMDIKFQRGIYALLGPNGAGKTTLLSMMMGAIRPDTGDITFEGVSLSKDRKVFNSKVGYLPQAPLFYKEFSGYEFLEYICFLKDIPKDNHKEQIDRVFRVVNLDDAKNKRVGAYSGGMRQKLGIAQALLGDPQILVFDEPTAGLDPIERIRFRNTISRLSSEKTIIIATHIVPDIESIAQSIVLVKDGVILNVDSPEALIDIVAGKVWALNVPMNNVDQFLDEHQISNIQLSGQHYALRMVENSQPHPDAILSAPRLEEAYIYLTKGKLNDSPAI